MFGKVPMDMVGNGVSQRGMPVNDRNVGLDSQVPKITYLQASSLHKVHAIHDPTLGEEDTLLHDSNLVNLYLGVELDDLIGCLAVQIHKGLVQVLVSDEGHSMQGLVCLG